MTITALFSTAPGLYAGNQVKILGMPVGDGDQDHTGTHLRDGPDAGPSVDVLSRPTPRP